LDHRVHRVFELQDFTAHIDGDLLGEVAGGHRDGHFRDVANLRGQVAGHLVDVIGEVLPGTGDARHDCLAAQPPFSAHLARDAAHFRCKRVELVDHGVDRVLQLEDFSFDVDGDLPRQVASRHGGGDLGDVPHLTGEVRGHEVDVVGQVLPGA